MRRRNLRQWLFSYLCQSIRSQVPYELPLNIIFCLVDHFEPYWERASDNAARRRVSLWVQKLSQIFKNFRDSEGISPRHNFFYPEEEYKEDIVNALSDLCMRGIADVEIHLHHDKDTSEGLREKLINFKTILYEKHGLLRKDPLTGDIIYGFIHGNWALDNSRKDGKWCGVNDEITILKKTGCYADFTLPSAPSDTQTKKINSIYYAKDDPLKPKSHNTGIGVEVGRLVCGDLMIIQGPLTLNWEKRKWGIFPRIENGEISWNYPPIPERIDLWIKQHIHIKGRPEWVFVKVYTHGAKDKNIDFFLNGGFEKMYTYLEERYNDGKNYVLHYVSAWEMYNIIKAAETGAEGNPSKFRDYLSKEGLGALPR